MVTEYELKLKRVQDHFDKYSSEAAKTLSAVLTRQEEYAAKMEGSLEQAQQESSNNAAQALIERDRLVTTMQTLAERVRASCYQEFAAERASLEQRLSIAERELERHSIGAHGLRSEAEQLISAEGQIAALQLTLQREREEWARREAQAREREGGK